MSDNPSIIFHQPDPSGSLDGLEPMIDPKDFGPMLSEAFQQVRKLLVGVDPQLMQAMFALATLEHILWIAGPGVAKSMAAEILMDMFEDADTLSLQLTKDMPSDAIFGHVIPKDLIESGEEIRNLDGGIVDVEFFYADEFMDASAWAIRSMLNVFNERKHRSKSQGEIDAPLHSVIATTNFYRTQAELEAVVDRFLSIAIMPASDCLVHDYRIGRGYTRTSGKDIRVPKLRYADLLAFAQWVESPDGIYISDGMMALHFMVTREFMERRYQMEVQKWADTNGVDLTDPHNQANVPTMRELGVFITPRRAAKTLDYVRAASAFQGRDVVQPEDIRAGGLSYCVIGESNGHEELWSEVCDELTTNLSSRDLEILNGIGTLTDLVGDLLAERGNDPEVTFNIGGKAFVATRQTLLEVRANAFGRKRNMHPAVKLGLAKLDECIQKLDDQVHKTGIKLPLWTH